MFSNAGALEPGLPDRDARLDIFESIIAGTQNGVVVTTPDGHAVYVNPAFTEITGYSRDHVIGKNMRLLQSGRQGQSFYEAMWQTLLTEGRWAGTIWNRRRDGEVYQEWLTVTAIRNESQETVAYVGVFSDISSIASREHLLERMAYFDPLTELPNQLLFHDRLTQALCFARQIGEGVSVVVLNLDGLGAINENYGFLAGDRVLQRTSREMLSGLGERDCLGRLGGDEFSAMLIGDGERTVRGAEAIRTTIAGARDDSEPPITVTASIGIARFPDHAEDADTLLAHAREAMYAAKRDGGNRISYYAQAGPGAGP